METHPTTAPEVASAFESFPQNIRERMLTLRALILATGNGIDPIGKVQESIKWGEPSYTTISGSPIRLAWKEKEPQRIAVCFHCQTKLVSTFKILYPKKLSFEGNRAIVLKENHKIPKEELKHCIELAHTYHRVKNLPLLGAQA